MTTRLTLITPAISAALREARFDDGRCPLDPAGARAARAAAGTLPAADRVLASPGARCRETAEALGLDAVPVPELAGCDAGRWRGLTLAEVTEREPAELARWLTDPQQAPHGGESVRALCDRVARWLESAAREAGRVVAVVEPDVARAAIVRALGAPESAFWRADVAPLAAVELSGRAGRWNVRMGRPLDGSP
ncbi:histidine phosphatase family protein [Streptomyces griseoviridis]|uniref:Histidine phosphatase family protein n=1 Tax=Streptomyces griseoviridis TaxID=45398 RepID=A0A3Q9L108_STRGD|nr:histidine phosphatase family protein [Streptomyces griseoviridis]AZS89120.1 histidine phosphatase family protein [Streptomyces griseoviridis]QCN84030.1 histidine phosphatase family protein [Streptomyces griseoviridis]